jgi:hypothetical protein
MGEAFHRRGHHVQKAHGRRTALAAEDRSHTQGGMIALMPTAADAKRLALPGGEPAAELHCTLLFLGDDMSVWTAEQRDALEQAAVAVAGDLTPVKAKIFGVAHWNGDGDKPSWVWSVGNSPDQGLADSSLEEVRSTLGDIMGMALAATDGDLPEIPEQHSPWAAHICAAYTDDLTLVRALEKRLGPVTFDRIRLSFGDDDRDIPLGGGALTASALRREALPHEEHCDFAEHNQQWEGAVESAATALAGVMDAWRTALRDQIASGMDTPEELEHLSLDPEEATGLIYDAMHSLAQRAGQALVREAEKQGVTVPEWTLPDDAVTAAVGGRRLLRSVAGMTASLLSSSLVQSAKRISLGLLTRQADPQQLAAEVDRALSEGQESAVRGPLGTAMATAQTAGRQAVLEAAPPAQYYASEILDRNTCGPCRAVDGEQFGSLEIAVKAYPVMGYKDCVGPRYGNACRGFIVASWQPEEPGGEAQTASAATLPPDTAVIGEGAMPWHKVHNHSECGSGQWAVVKDSDGSVAGCHGSEAEADKQLAALYSSEGDHTVNGDHFGSSNSLSDEPWNGAASAFSDEQWKNSTAACDPGPGTPKEKCFLPHHTPGGSLSRAGLGAAAGRANQLTGRNAQAQARAKAHLRGHYRAIGEPAPENLRATPHEIATFGVEEDYSMTKFAPETGGDCPPGMKMDEQSGKCMPMGDEEMAAGTQVLEIQGPDPADIGGENTAPWRGPLTVEGIETGDGREFDSEALSWADLPLPLRWNKEDSHGGEPHTVAVNVGRIDKIWREDSGLIMGEGLLDLGHEDGREVHRKIEGKFLRGVSVDVDSIKDADMTLVWPDTDPDGSGEPDPFAQMFAAPEKVVFHKGRIRAATLVDIPAFAEAYIALLGEDGAVVAGGEPIGALRASFAVRTRTLAVEPPLQPPADWFANPDLSVPTGITVTPEGRVYGHAALWGTCHIGQAGMCVTPPREDSHPYFMTGNVWTQDGGSASVGQITVGTSHAPLSMGHRAASDHYDNTGAAVADVAVGNDGHGIWVAGAIRPGSSPERIHELRAAGQVSGDWRRIGGQLRLVGLLAVNVPGFPVPKLSTTYVSGQQLALVAAGIPQLTEHPSEEDLDQWAYARIMSKLNLRVHGGE